MIVCIVGDDGAPVAARGWGMVVTMPAATARVMLSRRDLTIAGLTLGDLGGRMIAVTGCNVRTLRSVQVKGPMHTAAPAADGDMAVAQRYADMFFDDVAATDHIPRELMERLVPTDLVAVDLDVVESYDQTPGPGAGAPLARPAS